jgi:uncharacterized repeat protein (TIGR03847 family)
MRDLGVTDHLVAGAVGEPGRRTFFIEIGGEAGTEWFLVEKQQVAAFAEQALAMCREMGIPPQEPGSGLGVPGEPTFRVGEIGIGTAGEHVVVMLSPIDDDPSEPVAASVPPERLDAMARRALETVAAGRPTCRFCGLPVDPEGHTCPISNGDLRR